MNKSEVDAWLLTDVADQPFSSRLANALADRKIVRVVQIYGIDLRRMKTWKKVGKKTVNELVEWLREHPDPRFWPSGNLVVWDDDGKAVLDEVWKPTNTSSWDKAMENAASVQLVSDNVMAQFCDKLAERRERLVELIKDASVISTNGGGRRMRHFTSRLSELDTTIKMAKKAGVWVR